MHFNKSALFLKDKRGNISRILFLGVSRDRRDIFSLSLSYYARLCVTFLFVLLFLVRAKNAL